MFYLCIRFIIAVRIATNVSLALTGQGIDRKDHYRRLARLSRSLQGTIDVLDVCRGFQPVDDDFLKETSCTCSHDAFFDTWSAQCERGELCLQPEVGSAFSGDFSFQAKTTLGKSLSNDPNLQVADVINALFEGSN